MEKPNRPRPLSRRNAPDTATVYERAKPEKEAGMGRLDNNPFKAHKCDDKMGDAVSQKQGLRQINAEDVVDSRAERPAQGASLRPTSPKKSR